MSTVPAAPTYKSGKKSVAPTATAASDAARAAALQFLSQLAVELSSSDNVNLPCFPNVVIRIRDALANPKTTPTQAVIIAGAEPRLAARLLQIANSAAFNHSHKPLTDLRAAITRLGHQVVQSAAMAFAVQHMKNEQSLQSIAKSLSELWMESIAVASICQSVASRTKVSPDEAFLTGLLHGIGRLYVMVRAVGKLDGMDNESFTDLVLGWQASIGKSVLENWGFAEEMSEAVGDQGDRAGLRKRTGKHEADLADILIAGIVLSEALRMDAPRVVEMEGITAFSIIGLSAEDCSAILSCTEKKLGSLQSALGC
jgi:HD-like signal output (HDOD) protein